MEELIKNSKGQSLIEMIISISLGVVFLGIAAGSATMILRNNFEARTSQIAASLAQEYLDGVSSLAQKNWLNVYNPPAVKGPNSQFYLDASGGNYAIISGTTSIIIESRSFTRYFSIENVNRENCGVGNATSSGASGNCAIDFPGSSTDIYDDPSTQKITATVEWDNGQRKASSVRYLTRSQNASFQQSDWSGGFGQENFATSSQGTIVNNKFATSTGIDYSTTTGAIRIQGL